jgi:GxxExxY protein
MVLNSLHRRGTEGAEGPQRELTERIIAAAFAVHSELGAGLLEAVYQEALAYELADRGMLVVAQRDVPVIYRGRALKAPLRLDLLVDERVVIEVKAVDGLAPIHTAQLLTYLRLCKLDLGLLLNFNTVHLRDGIKRVANSLRTSASSVPLR